jgi:predicted transcriptional regulator
VKVREALLHPRVLGEDASAREAAEFLTKPNVESALVVGEGDRLVGCVTKSAIVAAVAAGRDVAALSARELCEPDVMSVGPDVSLDEALRVMGEHGLERLAVTENGRLLGVLPREPLVRRIAEEEPE